MISQDKIKEIGDLVWQRVGLPEDKTNATPEDFANAKLFLALLMVVASALRAMSWSKVIETMRALADGIDLVMQEDMKSNGN